MTDMKLKLDGSQDIWLEITDDAKDAVVAEEMRQILDDHGMNLTMKEDIEYYALLKQAAQVVLNHYQAMDPVMFWESEEVWDEDRSSDLRCRCGYCQFEYTKVFENDERWLPTCFECGNTTLQEICA